MRLVNRLCERLEVPSEEDDLANLPVSTTIARICKALGAPVDWSLWQGDDWAVAEQRQAPPGSSYARPARGAHRMAGEAPDPPDFTAPHFKSSGPPRMAASLAADQGPPDGSRVPP